MTDTNTYYKQNVKHFKAIAAKTYKTLTAISITRIIVFLITIVCIYFTYKNWLLASVFGVLGSAIFLYLLSKHTTLKTTYKLNKVLIKINEDELKIASGNFHYKNKGEEYQDANHDYCLDIDLFGRGSFFQFIDRTATKVGALTLANFLKANNTKNITTRQEAIKNLAANTKWRQKFQATASLISVETKPEIIIKWLQSYRSFLPKTVKKLPFLFSILSIVVISLVILKVIPIAVIAYMLLLGLLITGVFLKKINNLAKNTDKIRDTFRQYALLLDSIEQQEFNAVLLKEKQKAIKQKGKKASVILKELSKAMDALDNRNNLIAAIFGNGFFLTDLKHCYAIEKWLQTYKDKVNIWFKTVAFFDAYNSLGNYAFNYYHYTFPEILEQGKQTVVKKLGHPLLKTEKRIDNNFEINAEQFFIITGANMAGKSTFLRTVSLHIVMANVGLPVCAKSSKYVPIKLVTSMRASDSLTDESSYFFSELTRLKYIIDAIKQDNYFIILDEILKGTNSTDKAIGSRQFVEKLVANHATGIIATHDLSLCKIEKELKNVKNYYFDAQIINDELFFDYTFKKGICQNMNASFLLKKMNIV